MSEDSTARPTPDTAEVAWFVEYHQRALAAARRLAHAYAVLDGGLDVANDLGIPGRAAQVVKYQIEANLHIELGDFRRECLEDIDVEQTPRLAALWAMLTAALLYIDQNLLQLINIRQADRRTLDEARLQLRRMSKLLDEIIGDCVDAVVARAAAAEDV